PRPSHHRPHDPGSVHPLLAPEPRLRDPACRAGGQAAPAAAEGVRGVLRDGRGVPHRPGRTRRARVRRHRAQARAFPQELHMTTATTKTARIEALNDFVVKFANVNGSGSASANELFAKSFLRMGIPVSPRNIFPSNIQGLPTWYEVRVTEKGHLGRRGGVDLMVAMNPQTWAEDVKEIDPGGYLFY